MSNITAGEQHQIQAVIESGIMPLLAQKLLKAEFDIKKEACWAISNATTGGTPEQTRSFVDEATIQVKEKNYLSILLYFFFKKKKNKKNSLLRFSLLLNKQLIFFELFFRRVL